MDCDLIIDLVDKLDVEGVRRLFREHTPNDGDYTLLIEVVGRLPPSSEREDLVRILCNSLKLANTQWTTILGLAQDYPWVGHWAEYHYRQRVASNCEGVAEDAQWLTALGLM